MKKCDRCGHEKESFPLGDDVCVDCCNNLLLGGPSHYDWSQVDFEKGNYK